MDILIIGSRGREHALAIELKKDPRVGEIYCIPGNGGLSEIATCFKLNLNDFGAIADFLDSKPEIGLTIVSPDELLAKGLSDYLTERGHRTFGCSANAAKMEGCKEFSDNLCLKYNIPSPKFTVIDDYLKGKKFIQNHGFPIVLKTDGRSGGKGVFFCKNLRDAENAMYDVMVVKLFGASGNKMVAEEFVAGNIVMVMAFTDGKNVLPLPAVENYKRVYDGNLGMSTAGMGASYPAECYTETVRNEVIEKIIKPTVNALREEGCEFKGVLGFSVIVSQDGVKVVDFVSRFCDVEGQIIIPLIETPILDIMNAVIDGTLDKINLKIKDKSAICVVTTSNGYPLEYNKNLKINIGDDIDKDVFLFHAGTKLTDGELRTCGGRVITVASFGKSKEECSSIVYKNISKISFDGMHYRKDIGKRKN